MLRFFMFAFVFLIANSSSAQDVDYLQGRVIQGPFKTNVVNGGELYFLQTGSAEFPVSLVLDVVGADNKKIEVLSINTMWLGQTQKLSRFSFIQLRVRKMCLFWFLGKLRAEELERTGPFIKFMGMKKVRTINWL